MEFPNIFKPEDGLTMVVYTKRFKVGEFIGRSAWKCVKRIRDKEMGYGYVVTYDGNMARKLEKEGIDPRNGSSESLPDAFATTWLF